LFATTGKTLSRCACRLSVQRGGACRAACASLVAADPVDAVPARTLGHPPCRRYRWARSTAHRRQSGIVDASGVAVVPPVAFGASGAELPPEPVPPAPPSAVVVPPSPPSAVVVPPAPPAEGARSKAPSSEGVVPAPASELPPIAPAPSQDDPPPEPPAELPESALGPVPFFQQVLVLLAPSSSPRDRGANQSRKSMIHSRG